MDTKYKLVLFASKRARQINAYTPSWGRACGGRRPVRRLDVEDKPLSVALREINADKLVLKRLSSE